MRSGELLGVTRSRAALATMEEGRNGTGQEWESIAREEQLICSQGRPRDASRIRGPVEFDYKGGRGGLVRTAKDQEQRCGTAGRPESPPLQHLVTFPSYLLPRSVRQQDQRKRRRGRQP